LDRRFPRVPRVCCMRVCCGSGRSCFCPAHTSVAFLVGPDNAPQDGLALLPRL
jgi:hypothetical protein